MKRDVDFIAEIYPLEVDKEFIQIYGRVCDKELRLGDNLNDMEIIKIEAYGRTLDFISPGMTCRLTLKRRKGNSGLDVGYYYLEKKECSVESLDSEIQTP